MNNTMFISRSLVFYPGFFEDNCQELSDQIIVPSYYLNRLIDDFEDGEKLYLNMTNTNTNKNILVAIGSPHSFDRNTIFAPQWILDLIDCTGCCESVITLTKADMSEVPVATKIIIKPLDPIAFELDTLACFEKAFMNLHSIKEGVTLRVNVPELGKDYIIFSHIEKVEPAGISRIVRGEVDVEFINDFDKIIQPTATSGGGSSDSITEAPIIAEVTNTAITKISEEVSAEERRRIVRDSWIKRYQNNAGSL